MTFLRYSNRILVVISCILVMACEEFVATEPPSSKLVTETVFASDETAIAAVTGIYNELFRSDFSNGYLYSVTVLAGMSPDIFETMSATDTRYGPFQQNEISPSETSDAAANLNLWSSAYNIIYMTNSVLEGLANSETITPEIKETLEGQARFIRAFTYFYLTNLYGDVPLILTTDYRQNAVASRNPAAEVWAQVAADLDEALVLLEGVDAYTDSERTHVNRFVALALRARVYLYQQNWEKAEELSSQIIAQTSMYEILDDLDQVFLMNSREAIWQLSPLGGLGGGIYFTYTKEGYLFRGINSSAIKLSDDFIAMMQSQDKRLSQWVGFNGTIGFYFPQKYKDGNSWQNVSEYSMVLRLAEQHLIRAEARAMQGKLSDAIADVDIIRGRADLDLLADTNPGIGKEALLDVIMEERKRELFSEWGHRWLDLKRTGRASEVLAPIKPQWQDTDIFYPIPGEERAKNPNLGQNDGY